MPSSLPQTYKKKAVTLATWGAATLLDFTAETATRYFNFDNSLGLVIGNTYQLTMDGTTQTATATLSDDNSYIQLLFIFGSKQVLCVDNAYVEISSTGWHVYASYGKSAIFCTSRNYKIYGSVKLTVVDGIVSATLTDADVKVNSEVRFTLDEANGKLAGQFGLKKTIDKEAGKLTFTADTLPTSAISGTLEIGETSTEGAAFVDGINENVESTSSAVYFPSFVSDSEHVRPGIARGTVLFNAGEQQKEIDVTYYSPDGRGTPVAMARAVDTSFLPSVSGKLQHDASTNKTMLILVLSSAVPASTSIVADFILFFIKDV